MSSHIFPIFSWKKRVIIHIEPFFLMANEDKKLSTWKVLKVDFHRYIKQAIIKVTYRKCMGLLNVVLPFC